MHIDDIRLYSISFDEQSKELDVMFDFTIYNSNFEEIDRFSLIFRLKNGQFLGYDYHNFIDSFQQKKEYIIDSIKKSSAFDYFSSIVENSKDFEQIPFTDQVAIVQSVKKSKHSSAFYIYFTIKGFEPLFAITYRPAFKDFANLRLAEGYIFVNDIIDEEQLKAAILKDPKCRLKVLFQ